MCITHIGFKLNFFWGIRKVIIIFLKVKRTILRVKYKLLVLEIQHVENYVHKS